MEPPHTNLAAIALQHPPSIKHPPFHKLFKGPRYIHTAIMQTIIGHSFCRDYYAYFIPSKPTSCPCGEQQQARDYILAKCPLFEPHQHLLHEASHNVNTHTILSTKTELNALTKFIQASNAFTKTYTQIPSQTPTIHESP